MTLRVRIVQSPPCTEIADGAICDSLTLAHCWQLANERAHTFFVLAAAYLPDDTPDDVMQLWRTCYEDAEFVRTWLGKAA